MKGSSARMLTRNLVRYLGKRRSSTVSSSSTNAVKYPPILDLSKGATAAREREKYRDKLNSLDTIEEKLFYLNLQHYYGTPCFSLREGQFPFDFLPFVKFITRTRLVEASEKQFHQLLSLNSNETKELLDRIRPHLQEALLFELLGRNHENTDGAQRTGILVERINDVLLSSLSMQYQHLLDAVVDYRPRVEAFWMVGDFHPSHAVYNERKDKVKELEKENKKLDRFKKKIDIIPEAPVEHHVQYHSSPLVQLRSRNPLSQLDTSILSDEENTDCLSEVSYSPITQYGFEEDRRNGTNIPGYWPGDEAEFGLVAYHHMKDDVTVPESMQQHGRNDKLKCQAVLSGFSWLHAQASYQGFSSYNELTYPLATQQVITDGRRFCFSLYQLNTTIFHKVLHQPNNRTNICVSLPELNLYQEISKNQFVGWNDTVLLNLLGFYLNKPEAREVDMKPHVNPAVKTLADIGEEERRVWLHNQFRHMYANRPRHRLGYEIYDWERIYKIAFDTLGMDAKRRPFEYDQNPTEDRKYYDHLSAYVKKDLRPKKKHWAGWRSKFAKTYYPDPK